MDGPLTVSRAATGKRQCSSQRDVVSSRQSERYQPCPQAIYGYTSLRRVFACGRRDCASGCWATYMLVYEQDSNVLALAGEAIKGSLDGRILRFRVHNEEVLLVVWRLRNMLVW